MKQSDPDTLALIIAARAAALQMDADLFSLKQSLRDGDGKGGLKPFDRRRISRDDRQWFEMGEKKFLALNSALAAFDADLPNPASL